MSKLEETARLAKLLVARKGRQTTINDSPVDAREVKVGDFYIRHSSNDFLYANDISTPGGLTILRMPPGEPVRSAHPQAIERLYQCLVQATILEEIADV